ncbi:hypothetical protein [Sinomonas sp. P47F7]|uniref:hypothetical protein n=1 Tax=Sinomonas sp. P47F7 TaxID=3410987 RepID=UPI003BF4BBF2
MPRNNDALLLESVGTHRRRLRQALLFGRLDDRRQVTDNVRRFIGGIVLAAVVGVGCLGFSFVTAATAHGTGTPGTPAPQSTETPQGSASPEGSATPQRTTAARTTAPAAPPSAAPQTTKAKGTP